MMQQLSRYLSYLIFTIMFQWCCYDCEDQIPVPRRDMIHVAQVCSNIFEIPRAVNTTTNRPISLNEVCLGCFYIRYESMGAKETSYIPGIREQRTHSGIKKWWVPSKPYWLAWHTYQSTASITQLKLSVLLIGRLLEARQPTSQPTNDMGRIMERQRLACWACAHCKCVGDLEISPNRQNNNQPTYLTDWNLL